MTRISINGKGQAFDGDLTTTGAVCIAGSTNYRGNNQRALRLGDATTECPECKKPGVISDSIRKIQKWSDHEGPHRSADIEGLRAWDDIGDRVAISIGVNLYKLHPNGGITAEMLMAEVLALPRSSWGDGIRDHACK